MEDLERVFIKTLRSKKFYRDLLLVVLVVIAVMIVYMLIMHVNINILLHVDPILLLASMILYGFSNVIDAIRLKILFKNVGYRMSIVDAFKARIMGNVVALATPSSVGGEPVRALILASYGIRLSRAIAVTLFEDYWDIIIINIPALSFAVMRLPITIFVLLSSIYNIVAWNILFLAVRRKSVRGFLSRLRDKSIGIIRKFLDLLLIMVSSVEHVSTSLNIGTAIRVIGVTLAKYTIVFSSFLLAARSIGKVSLQQTLEALVFYNAMGPIPTPGAAGGAEYGLSMVLSPEQVIVVRAVAFFTTIILGLPVFMLYVRRLHESLSTNINISTTPTTS